MVDYYDHECIVSVELKQGAIVVKNSYNSS